MEDDNGTVTATHEYDFVHPEYTIFNNGTPTEKLSGGAYNNGNLVGPITGINFGSKFGSISGITLFYCTNADPNNFYGCSYPEIWKLSTAVTSGVFILSLIVIFFYARSQSPFVKIKEQNPILQSGHVKTYETNWEDLEHLQVVIL